ncbi:MAG: hypothetical protein E3K32_06550 [wastewater metagenome]|nr:hypothetical protein [Candidatus Loosdrechtia aerotolerans]
MLKKKNLLNVRCIEEAKQLPNAESENKLSTKLNRLTEIARVEPGTKFTSLAHLLDEENLKQCYEELRKDAAAGIDKVSHEEYRKDLEANLRDLVKRLKANRYCDDFIIGCTNKQAAEKVWRDLGGRLKKFGLEISETKSRLIEFGMQAYYKSGREGKKVKTFDFLGFTHYMGKSRKGTVKPGRKTIGKRMRKSLIVLNERLRKLRNILSFQEQHKHLCRVLNGYYNYYGFAGNSLALSNFSYRVRRLWFKWLNRRSQRKSFNWNKFNLLLKRHPLPKPRIVKGYSWIYSST